MPQNAAGMRTLPAPSVPTLKGPRPAATAAAVPPAQAADPVVFTVGILSDIDSLNPFTGILAESYEMFQLQYSTLLSSSSADFTPDSLRRDGVR